MTFEKKMPTMGIKNDNQDADNNDVKNNDASTGNSNNEKLNLNNQVNAKEGDNEIENNDVNKEIEELRQKNSELERKLLYLAAEYENNKKRNKIELDNANKFAISKFAIDAVNIYDILLTALQNADKTKTDDTLLNGVKMTIGEFDKMFERIQITKIEPDVGTLFDHNKHEAISRVQNELEVGCIVKVVRAGYELYGRLLRPAMVIVSGGK